MRCREVIRAHPCKEPELDVLAAISSVFTSRPTCATISTAACTSAWVVLKLTIACPQHKTAIDDRIRDEGFAAALQTIKNVPIEGIEVPLNSRLSESRAEVTRHTAERW
jgi:hypothetical protein